MGRDSPRNHQPDVSLRIFVTGIFQKKIEPAQMTSDSSNMKRILLFLVIFHTRLYLMFKKHWKLLIDDWESKNSNSRWQWFFRNKNSNSWWQWFFRNKNSDSLIDDWESEIQFMMSMILQEVDFKFTDWWLRQVDWESKIQFNLWQQWFFMKFAC